jgi:urea transport system substrate-binding protein
VIGEELLPSDIKAYKDIAGRIAAAEPTVILNTVSGGQNHGLLVALRAAGIVPWKIPTVSFDLDEQTLRGLPSQVVAGDYISSNYSAATPGLRNKEFVDRYRAQWGDAYAITDAMEAAWLGVQFWAQAVEKARTAQPTAVCRAFGNQHIDAPEGPDVRIDPDNQHAWRYFRLGQVMLDGSIRNLRSSEKPLPPAPFPTYRSQAEWERLLKSWHEEWRNNWSPSRE